MRTKLVSDSHGFSLVEVVVMMAILSVALLATISSIMSSMTLVRVGEENTLALNAGKLTVKKGAWVFRAGGYR